ncbi:MAG: DNA-3-methyladenine glycosylase family protein, partial [Candidatus Thorarchaeota archaeon]
MEFEIKVPKDYDLLSSVHAWIFPEIQPVPEKTWENNFGRLFTIGSKQVEITLHQEKPGSSIQVTSSGKGVRRKSIEEKIGHTLGISIDLKQVHDVMKTDSHLAPIASAVAGIRPYSTDTPFESLIKGIIQQQISYKAANVITKRLVEATSNESSMLFQFPDYQSILDLGPEGMRSIGLGYKVPYIQNVCELIERKELVLDTLVGKTYEEVSEVLKPIKGIGEWTIQVLAIAGLSDFSVYPFGDLGIQNVLGKIFNKGKRM